MLIYTPREMNRLREDRETRARRRDYLAAKFRLFLPNSVFRGIPELSRRPREAKVASRRERKISRAALLQPAKGNSKIKMLGARGSGITSSNSLTIDSTLPATAKITLSSRWE